MRKVAFLLMTLILIGILCGCICGLAGVWYIHEYVEPNTYIDVSKIGMNFTSMIYAKDPNTGEYYEYETLSGDENRVWANLEDIPLDLQKAVVAIEDQRFYQHKGVDWKRTAKGVINWVTGDTGGGSTITQQLIKNILQEKDYSIQRKVYEIFRALKLEETLNGDKDRILEMYLNTIFLGNRCYGVQTAAETYFGKELYELNLPECAALAGITNNPSKYNPFRYPENVKMRQEIILEEMKEQGLITEEEYNSAVAYELVYFTDEVEEKSKATSWFTDAVIQDVINDLCEEYGYDRTIAKNIVYSGGLQIYITIDTDIQKIMDEVYADEANFPNASKNGTVPQSAMVVCDKQGNVLGMVGARGEKTTTGDLNRATQAYRQPGSSIKPITVYAPAMDAGDITPYAVVTDMPVYVDANGSPRPRNDSGDYRGQTVIRDAVARSVNAVAMRILQNTTPEAVYALLTDTLGFREVTLADCDLAPLSLGGMTKGVTVREMAGAFTMFVNDGKYSGTRTYTQVFDHDGELLLDNTPEETQVFQREQTTYYMTEVLTGVTERGTATRARISGIETAGKTGTTNSNRDRWFCGYTPYYVGATWFGYDEDYNLSGISGNPSVTLWTAVMQKIHEDLPNASFDEGDDSLFTRASYCTNTGLRPNGSCPTATGRFYKGDEPVETCGVCCTKYFCKDSGKLWQEGICPEESKISKTMMDMTRYFPVYVSIGDADKCFTGVNEPIVVANGTVMVSGTKPAAADPNSTGAVSENGEPLCDFVHEVTAIPGVDPEQIIEGLFPFFGSGEGEDGQDPQQTTTPDPENSGDLLSGLHDLFS